MLSRLESELKQAKHKIAFGGNITEHLRSIAYMRKQINVWSLAPLLDKHEYIFMLASDLEDQEQRGC